VLASDAVKGSASAVAATVNVQEVQVSTTPTSLAGRAWEPSVAAHPTQALTLAAVYVRGSSPVRPVVRISHDGGITWRSASGRAPGGGIHVVLAWGPGPTLDSTRLYLANMTSSGGGLRLGTSYSDDEGESWSVLKVQTSVPAWVGGTPDIAVDSNPTSPNYGVVYATWNWPASANANVGLRVIASSDYGQTFHAVEVPALPKVSGYAARQRIGYRLRTAPDGAVYVTWYQADLRTWSSADPLAKGSLSNIGKIRFGIARLLYHRDIGEFTLGVPRAVATLPRTAWNAGYVRPGGLSTDPQWSTGLVVDPVTGQLWLAVSVDGGIQVYTSTDAGSRWAHHVLPLPAAIKGRAQWIGKPDLVQGTGFMAVTMRLFDKSGDTSGHAYSLSYDGGITWTRPTPIGSVRWAAARVSGGINGVGLRNRAVVTADGTHIMFVYGDGRYGQLGLNRSAIFGARITVVVPVLAPSVTQTCNK